MLGGGEGNGDSSKESDQVFQTCDIRNEKIAPFISILLKKLSFGLSRKSLPFIQNITSVFVEE